MSNKKIVKSSMKISTREFAEHRGGNIVLSPFSFAEGAFEKIEMTNRISVRVGSRRKLFRISKIELEESTSEYPSTISLHAKAEKSHA